MTGLNHVKIGFFRWITKRRESLSSEGSPVDQEDDQAYCYCRQPWQGRFMIQCDYCDVWYHGSCVNVTAAEGLGIQKYKCGTCKMGNDAQV